MQDEDPTKSLDHEGTFSPYHKDIMVDNCGDSFKALHRYPTIKHQGTNASNHSSTKDLQSESKKSSRENPTTNMEQLYSTQTRMKSKPSEIGDERRTSQLITNSKIRARKTSTGIGGMKQGVRQSLNPIGL